MFSNINNVFIENGAFNHYSIDPESAIQGTTDSQPSKGNIKKAHTAIQCTPSHLDVI